VIPADAEETVLTAEEIAEKYGVALSQAHNWTRMEGFPAERPRAGQKFVRDAKAVDRWLHVNFPLLWARTHHPDNPYGLPAKDPGELVSLSAIAGLEGKILGRDEPVPLATLRGYLTKKTMPPPDRTPADGLRPQVTERMWYWKTASQWLNRPRKEQRASRLDVDQIAAKYDITGRTASKWTQTPGFPDQATAGKYDVAEVDDWVRENRPRTWAAATEQSEPTPPRRQSPRNQSGAAPADEGDKEPVGSEQSAEGAGQARKAQGVVLGAEGIAQRFNVSVSTAAGWTSTEGKTERGKVIREPFPAPVRPRARPRQWDTGAVDDWVKKNRPHVWSAFASTGPPLVQPLPEGNPRDLLDMNDFAEIWGNATRGEPLERETMIAYHNRGQIPFRDRAPDDGGTPRVFAYHWYRQTVYEFILSRRGRGRFGPR